MKILIAFVIWASYEYVSSGGTTTPHPIAGPSHDEHQQAQGLGNRQYHESLADSSCDNFCDSEGEVTRLVYENDPDNKVYPCKLCSKIFEDSTRLQRHMATHTDEKPFSCEICGNRFKNKDRLRSHMAVHSDKALFSCYLCNRRFKQKCNLKVHIRIHTGDKPYSCQLCGMLFSDASSCRKHVATHENRKNCACKLCGKKFRDKFNLKSHMKTHLNKGLVSCKVCGKEYKSTYFLKKHMNHHVTERPGSEDSSELCHESFGLTRNMETLVEERVFLRSEECVGLQVGRTVDHRPIEATDFNLNHQQFHTMPSNLQVLQTHVPQELNQESNTAISIHWDAPDQIPGTLYGSSSGCSCHRDCGIVGENYCVIDRILGLDHEYCDPVYHNEYASNDGEILNQPAWSASNSISGTSSRIEPERTLEVNNRMFGEMVGIDYGPHTPPVLSYPEVLGQTRRITLDTSTVPSCVGSSRVLNRMRQITSEIMTTYYETQRADLEDKDYGQTSE